MQARKGAVAVLTGPQPPRPPETLLNGALRLLAARRRGVEELRGRLIRKGFSPVEVDACLSWLKHCGLLDDAAFSEALVKDRLRFSPRSPALLRRELARRGIHEEVAAGAVDRVFQEESISEHGVAQEAGRRWVARQGPETLARLAERDRGAKRNRARRRLYGFLVRKGFRGDAARAGMDAARIEARKVLVIKD